MQLFDAHTGGKLEKDPIGKVAVGCCMSPNILSFLDEGDRKEMTNDNLDIKQHVVGRCTKKRKQ